MAKMRQRMVRMVQQTAEGDREVELDPSAYGNIVEQQGRALRSAGEMPGTIVLYDQVDGSPFKVKRELAILCYLNQDVAICSACRHPSVWNDDITGHIGAARRNAELHRDAVALDFVTQTAAGKRCSACDATFLSRPQNVHEHIQRAKAGGALHANAKVQVIQRFSLQPPVLERPSATPVATAGPASQASADDRSGPRRHRRRRRHRKGKAA